MPAPNEYFSGTRVELTATFTDINGNPVDPTTITFRYIDPSTGAIVSLIYGVDGEVTKVSTGIYRLNVDTISEGMWVWRCEGIDTPQISEEAAFKVLASPFVPG